MEESRVFCRKILALIDYTDSRSLIDPFPPLATNAKLTGEEELQSIEGIYIFILKMHISVGAEATLEC